MEKQMIHVSKEMTIRDRDRIAAALSQMQEERDPNNVLFVIVGQVDGKHVRLSHTQQFCSPGGNVFVVDTRHLHRCRQPRRS